MKKKRVLIVDDDETLLEVLKARISPAGYMVFTLNDAKSIFAKIEETTPDVILLDVMMPEVDGFKVKAKLNKDAKTASIPTIFLTGRDAGSDKEKGLRLGVDDYITKPFDGKELLARIKAAIQKREFYERISMTDGLTGLWNVNFFKKQLAIFFNIAKRYKKVFSLILIDIDNFKYINDAYGHVGGDFILNTFAKIAKGTLRKSDIIMRYGGDEFVIIMPETDEKQAKKAVKRLKGAIKDNSFNFQEIGKKLTFSISAGIAAYKKNVTDESQIFKLADKRLYEDKKRKK